MHMAPRILRGYNHHVICKLPTNAIIAGCTQSTYFAKVLLFRVVKCHLERCPKANISTHQYQMRTFIDDVAQRFYGTRRQVAANAIYAGSDLALCQECRNGGQCTPGHECLTGLGCVINARKSVYLAPRLHMRTTVANALRMRGLRVKTATVARDLGLGAAGAYRRVAKFIMKRLICVKGRVHNVRKMVKAHKRACSLFNTGCHPQMTYGKEAYGANPALLSQWRSLAAYGVGGGGGKCATTLIACRLGQHMDPYVLALRGQLKMLSLIHI